MTEADRIHQAIVNLPGGVDSAGVHPEALQLRAYRMGHRDARHAAAEIAQRSIAKLEARNTKLREACEVARRELNCIIGQAVYRGETAGGPKRVVTKLTAALAGEGERE